MSNHRESSRAPEDAGLETLVNYVIDNHHAFTYAAFDRLSAQMAEARKSAAGVPPELDKVAELLNSLRLDLLSHMPKEERILFPYISSLDRADRAGGPAPRAMFGTVANPIRMMTMEHEGATRLLSELRAATKGFAPPSGASADVAELYRGLAELERDLVEHMRVENDVLFPRAGQLEARLRAR